MTLPSATRKRKSTSNPLPPPPPPPPRPQPEPEPVFESEAESEAQDSVLSCEEGSDERELLCQLLEPFSKEELIELLTGAASENLKLRVKLLRSLASDPIHCNLFVHGLAPETTSDLLSAAFSVFGPVMFCHVVMDKSTSRCKGYGFILFENALSARRALASQHVIVGSRAVSCQLACEGSTGGSSAGDIGARRLFVGNVSPHVSPEKLKEFFEMFGEIEEGPMGMDLETGKFRGFVIFIYKSVDGISNALMEPVKEFEGMKLRCSLYVEAKKNFTSNNRAIDGTNKSAEGSVLSAGMGTVSGPILNFQSLVVNHNQGVIGINPSGPSCTMFGMLNPLRGMSTGSAAVVNPGFAAALNSNGGNPPIAVNLRLGGAHPDITGMSSVLINGGVLQLQGLGASDLQRYQFGAGMPGAAAGMGQSGGGAAGGFPPHFC